MLQESESTYYNSLTIQQRQTYDNQERFLKAYASLGKLCYSADACNISIKTVEDWQSRDVQGFVKRLQHAHQRYVESLEMDMDQYIRDSKHNTQILRIFRLKAELPEKYREDVKIQGLEPLTSLLEEARKLAARDIQKRQELESGAVEADVREVDNDGSSIRNNAQGNSAPYNKEADG